MAHSGTDFKLRDSDCTFWDTFFKGWARPADQADKPDQSKLCISQTIKIIQTS